MALSRRLPDPVSVETMLASIESQAGLIPAVTEHMRPQVQAAAAQTDLDSVKHVFVTGCGDSLYAALAVRLAFEMFSGYRMEPIEALEFSRYSVDSLPAASLVIGVSAGGDKSRTIEALVEARKRGARTWALTGVPDSPLGQQADVVLVHNERDLRPAPIPGGPGGVFSLGNYLASVLTLYEVAFELGRVSGKTDTASADGARAAIRKAPQIIRTTISANDRAIADLARDVASAPAYYLVGGGPSYATAMFGAAKLFEMPQAHGVPVELEEWAHEQYFLTRKGTVFVAIAPPGASTDRAREQLLGAREVGAFSIAVCDDADSSTADAADLALPIKGALPECFSPLVYCIPLEQFAAHLCRAMGKDAFAFISATQFDVNMRQIGRSAMRK